MNDKSCKTCVYHDLVNGECRRYPPIPIRFDQIEVASVLPKTRDLEWCGEYILRRIG